MTENHWNILLRSTKMQTMEKIPVGLIVSASGGTSPGTTGQNIRAMIDTVMNQ